jgi:peptidoglycan/LPS O-acetylase OafA/YrhL
LLIEAHPAVLSKHNNFDLVRLLAALQVVLVHFSEHLHIWVPSALGWFPGVPIFFSISGFLVTASLARCASPGEYFRNRALRIYPALFVMTAVTLVLLAAFGFLNFETPRLRLAEYLAGQLTLFQQVGGGIGLFDGFGVGRVNGALWTIATELQFYLLLPLMLWSVSLFGSRRRLLALGLLFLASLLVYELLLPAWTASADEKSTGTARIVLAALYTSIPAHLFGFLIGVVFYLKLPLMIRFVQGKFLLWIALYLGVSAILSWGLNLSGWDIEKNVLALVITRLLLAGVIFSLAFTSRGIAQRMLRGNDVSYGIYIYHMLIVNALIALGATGSLTFAALGLVAIFALAFASWRLVEKPSLRLKRHERPVVAAAQP